jgi:hypothetical protein
VHNEDLLLFFNALTHCAGFVHNQAYDQLVNKARLQLPEFTTEQLVELLRWVSHAGTSAISEVVQDALEDKLIKELKQRDLINQDLCTIQDASLVSLKTSLVDFLKSDECYEQAKRKTKRSSRI